MHWRRRRRCETESRGGPHAGGDAWRRSQDCRYGLPGGQEGYLPTARKPRHITCGSACGQLTDVEAQGQSLGEGHPRALAGRASSPSCPGPSPSPRLQEAQPPFLLLSPVLKGSPGRPGFLVWGSEGTLSGPQGTEAQVPMMGTAHDGNSDTSLALLPPLTFLFPHGASWSHLPYQLLTLISLFQGLLWEGASEAGRTEGRCPHGWATHPITR